METSIHAEPESLPPRPRSQTFHFALLAAILIFAAAIRLYGLAAESMWYDECATVSVIRAPWPGLLKRVVGVENTPPLHYILLKAWSEVAGFSEFAMRLPSALLGVLSVYLLYRLCSYCVGKNEALIAAALMAASRYHLFYSQEARAYMLMVAMAIWSTDELVRMLDHPPSWKRDLRYWLATVLLLYSHIYAVFAIAAQVAHYLYRLARRQPMQLTLTKFAQLQLAVWILFALWIPVLVAQFRGRAPGFMIEPASGLQIARSYALYIGDGNLALIVIATSLLVLGAARKELRSFLPLLLTLLLAPVVAPVIFALLTHPLYIPRYGLIAMIGLFILIACGIARFPKPIQALLTLATIAMMLLAPNPQPKPRYREAGAYLTKWMQPGDYVEVNNIPQIEPVKYYLTRDDVKHRAFRGFGIPLGVPLPDARTHVWMLLYECAPAQSGVRTIQLGNWRVASQKSFGDFAIFELADGATEAKDTYPDEIRFNAKPVTKDRTPPATLPAP